MKVYNNHNFKSASRLKQSDIIYKPTAAPQLHHHRALHRERFPVFDFFWWKVTLVYWIIVMRAQVMLAVISSTVTFSIFVRIIQPQFKKKVRRQFKISEKTKFDGLQIIWILYLIKNRALILGGVYSTQCWKHSSEILLHIDVRASHSCCRFISWTSMMRKSVPQHPKGATLGEIWWPVGSQWSQWSFVTWSVILLKGSIRRWVHCAQKGVNMVSNNTQVGCGVWTMFNWY